MILVASLALLVDVADVADTVEDRPALPAGGDKVLAVPREEDEPVLTDECVRMKNPLLGGISVEHRWRSVPLYFHGTTPCQPIRE